MTTRRARRFGTVAMLVTSLTALAAVAVALWSGGLLNPVICGGECGAAAVSTPDDLNLDPVIGPMGNTPGSTGQLDADAIRSAVAEVLADDDAIAGGRVGFAAADPVSGTVVATSGASSLTPASTTKLLTALTVLSTVDEQQRFSTRVVRTGDRLVLVGGGDPYLASEPPPNKSFAVEADLQTLAARTSSALRAAGLSSVRLDYDASLFSGPAVNPHWEESYVTEKIVTPISALWADQGVVGGVRVDDPAAGAAEEFKERLEDAGLEVDGDPRSTSAPAAAAEVAAVRSATVARITERMIETSDNEAAEVLLRHAALGAGRPGSFDGGLAAEATVLRAKGIDTNGLEVHDGSGLSRDNRIAPATLAQVVAVAAADPRASSLIADLPTANFSGSLLRRFGTAKDGRGVVRAKTGTLKGVHSLAGYVTDRNGTPIAFAAMIDGAEDISALDSEAAVDAIAAGLAACTCSTTR